MMGGSIEENEIKSRELSIALMNNKNGFSKDASIEEAIEKHRKIIIPLEQKKYSLDQEISRWVEYLTKYENMMFYPDNDKESKHDEEDKHDEENKHDEESKHYEVRKLKSESHIDEKHNSSDIMDSDQDFLSHEVSKPKDILSEQNDREDSQSYAFPQIKSAMKQKMNVSYQKEIPEDEPKTVKFASVQLNPNGIYSIRTIL
jgi:hypothetical protein